MASCPVSLFHSTFGRKELVSSLLICGPDWLKRHYISVGTNIAAFSLFFTRSTRLSEEWQIRHNSTSLYGRLGKILIVCCKSGRLGKILIVCCKSGRSGKILIVCCKSERLGKILIVCCKSGRFSKILIVCCKSGRFGKILIVCWKS